MTKRYPRLILLSIILALLFAVSALQGWATSQGETTQGITEVAIVQSDSPTVADAEVEAMVRQAVALAGGLEDVIEPGDTVVIKPNLVWDALPEYGHVTDPIVTRAVVRLAQEAGAGQVFIAEGSAVYVSGKDDRFPTKAAFHVSGHDGNHDMVDDVTSAPLIDLNISGDDTDAKDPAYVTSVTLSNGLIRNQYWIPNADVLIGVPVLKNHSLSGLTLSLKNMIGIAPNDIYHAPGKSVLKSELSHSAKDLPRHIVDLNLCRPMDFVVVDGLRGMTDGPNGNHLADPPMKLIMAGRDPVAVDTVGALVISYDPASISYLPLAQQAGLGTMDVSHIRVLGRPVAEVRQDFPVPYGDPSVERAESEPPTIQITYPSEGETVSGLVNIQATASDNAGLARIEFYLNDAYLGLAADAPYRLALDTSQYSNGPHTLKAIAYDRALNQTAYEHTINVTGGLTPTPTPLPATLTVSSLTIPSYPYEDYLQDEYNSTYNVTFKRLDWGAYAGAPKTLTERTFTALVMENEYLRLTVLPELGGRIYQCVFKPTGHNQFYQNPVLKPTRWGPPEQGWWLAAGGMEWGLPVEEHGYETAMPWTYTTVTASDGVTVTVQDSTADDRLRASVDVYLPSGKSYFAVRPHIENPTGSPLNYKYWTNAILAPGGTNQPSGQLEFVLPVDRVTVHSRDKRWEELPGEDQPMSWPIHNGLDLSIYGHWSHYLGFFERPAAQKDFMGLYEHSVGEGMVRVYPSAIAQGAKAFGFGHGSEALDPELWTDGDSSYVELHGGVAPTFADSAFLGPRESIHWSEFWYPVKDIGGFVYANREAALNLEVEGGQTTIGVAATAPHSASQVTLRRRSDGGLLFHEVIPYLTPAQPYRSAPVAVGGLTLDDLSLVYADAAGEVIAAYQYTGPSPTPTSTPTPPPPTRWIGWVESNTTSPSGGGPIVLRVSVEGLVGLPVTIRASGGWSTTNWTGTKTEYGPYFCEFAPLPTETFTVVPEGLGVSVQVPLWGPGVAVVRFAERPGEPTPTPTASPTATPTPTGEPTIEPTPTATPCPTPETAWMGRVEYNTTQPGGSGLIVLRVSVDGLWGLPVTVTANGWSTTNWTGTKTEYGPYFCEFAPMPMGTLTVIPQGLGVSVRVSMRGPGVAVVRFAQRPVSTPTPTATATPTVLPSPTLPTPTATSTATGTPQPTFSPTATATPTSTPTPTTTATGTPQPTLSPTATFTPTGTPTATATSTPTPPPQERWVGRGTSNTTYQGAGGPVVLRVSADGLIGLPVTVTANGWSTTNWTGTKTEYGPYFCEFAPMPVGTLTVIPQGLGVSVRVSMRGAGVAVVEFWRE